MKKNPFNKLFIAVLSIALLSSCSQVRQATTSSNYKLHLIKADKHATTTARAGNEKAELKKEVKHLPERSPELIGVQQEKNAEVKPVVPKSPVLHSLPKVDSKETPSKSKLTEKKVEKINKVLDRINSITEKGASKSDSKSFLPYGHSDASRFLWLWIGALVLEIIFIALLVATLSIIFYILAVLAGLAATIFFIIWLVKLFA
jgi:hypothetical protein